MKKSPLLPSWQVFLFIVLWSYLLLFLLGQALVDDINAPGMLIYRLDQEVGGDNFSERGRRGRELLLRYSWQLVVALIIAWGTHKPLKVWLEPHLTQKPPPEPPKKQDKASFLFIPEERNDPIDFRAAKPSLHGRTAELEQLKAFAMSDPRFSWWWLQGAGGIGKSKLALTWVKDQNLYNEPFEAGFLTKNTTDWSIWQPGKPTFIVIDDAADKALDVLAMLEQLAERAEPHKLQHKVRVLIVERPATESLKPLEERRIYTDYRHAAKPLLPSTLDKWSLTRIAEDLGQKAKAQAVHKPLWKSVKAYRSTW